MPLPRYRGTKIAGYIIVLGLILMIAGAIAIAINVGQRPNSIIDGIGDWSAYYRNFAWGGAGISLGLILWLTGLVLGGLDRIEAQLYELHATTYNNDRRADH